MYVTDPYARSTLHPEAAALRKQRRLRRYFLTGLVVIAPVGLTVIVLRWVFQTLDDILGDPLRVAIGVQIPGLGFLLLVLFILGVGWIVHQAAGRQLLHWWNTALVKFPLTGRIYNTVSQIVQTVVGSRRKVFQRAVLVPYPTEDLWAVAFLTHETPAIISDAVGEPCINVFVPTTPNPTSGFMLLVPTRKVREIDMSIEEATKLVISAGSVLPSDAAAGVGRRGLDLDTLFTTTHD